MEVNYPPSIIELKPPPPNALPDCLILFDEIETPEIPASLLPEVFGEFARALALATETPEALSVMTVLGVLSVCLAKRFKVSPIEGWQEPINIYTLIALPPANNKSLVLNTCTKPLVEWEAEQASILERDVKRQRSERKSQEKCIESLRLKMAKEKDETLQKGLIREIADMEATLTDLPALPQLFANDATPESLAQSTYEQGGRFAIFSDEGGILETLGGLYSNGITNIDILLKGIDGGEVRVRRKDRNYNLKPYLTFVLAVQPAILSNLGQKRAYLGNGALERFLYALPKSKLGFRTHDKPPLSAAIQHAYNARIHALLNLSPILEKDPQPRLLTLAPSAYKEWREFQLHIESQLRPDGKLSPCLGWGGKICGFALRIAGLLQLAQTLEHTFVIGEECMNKALAMAALLTDHALAAYNLLGTDQSTEDAKEILRWMKVHGQSPLSQSEITLAMRNRRLGKAERLHKALKVLVDRNILTPQRIPTPKKSTVEYHLHPSIL